MFRFSVKTANFFFSKQFICHPFSSASDTFISTTCNSYLQKLYQQWKNDPQQVNESWSSYFKSIQPSSTSMEKGPILSRNYKLQQLIRAYQVRGHHRADVDPLGISCPDLNNEKAPELNLSYYGFTETEMDNQFSLGDGILANYFPSNSPPPTLRQVLTALERIYCSTIGLEYMHIPSREKCDWLRNEFERPDRLNFSPQERKQFFRWLAAADSFETFVHAKFPGEKRFALEGCESFIPGMMRLLETASELGTKSIVLGMAHRGRVNVLSNVVHKPNESIFCEFNGDVDPTVEGSGDVKYHLGMNCDRILPNGRMMNISLVANPSHLEAVAAVVLGKAKGLQFFAKDTQLTEILPVIVHGDAAFSGQGVVYESMEFSDLPSYSVGGTIHIVINNQIGFTTDPRFSRSTPYCTDIAKVVNAPIMHVNADDVEAVVFCMQLAMKWRDTFKKDVVVDLIGYRRHGHNEFDEPAFTQPRMYKAIQSKRKVLDVYGEKLIKVGIMSQEEAEAATQEEMQKYAKAYEASKTYVPTTKEWLTSIWNGFPSPSETSSKTFPAESTGITKEQLKLISNALVSVPEGFTPHKGIQRLIETRKKMLSSQDNPALKEASDSSAVANKPQSSLGLDMGTAEALAIGSLLLEGIPVRFSGQDVERGTFSQRHAVFHDQHEEKQHVQLNHISEKQAEFQICNSSLSEFGVLGFEYGYSLVDPNLLVLWEAQFGDFANNAQCIIDQFIVSAERKWIQRSGLTLLLPHGYDGAGPEHSNAHIERFLSLCDDNPEEIFNGKRKQAFSLDRALQECNIQVVVPTTPANYFHVLRRQVKRRFRKPLIVFTSKNLLRHPMARSSISKITEKTKFLSLIPDSYHTGNSSKSVKRLLLCSGQVYFAVLKEIESKKLSDTIAITRIEQLSPFPYELLATDLLHYPNLSEIVWVQEEAQNVGPWFYVKPRIEVTQKVAFPNGKFISVQYAGRKPYAGIATGFKKQHIEEEQLFISQALAVNK